MDREKAIKLFRRDIECLSHDKCSDCILEEACDPMKTPPDSEYIAAYGMAIEALSAEPCEDAISRQAVMDFIRGLTRWCVRSEDGKFNNVGLLYDDVMFGLDRLPSVTPKQKMGRWIPVSERLPDIHNYCMKYLVTDCHGHINTSLFTESGGKCWWSREDVIAWQPLPEPYKAESEDKNERI